MRKKLGFLIGCVALIPILIVVLLRTGTGVEVPRAAAAHLDTSFSSPYNISNSSTYDSTQHARLRIAPDNFLHVTWMEGIANTANGPAYVRGEGTSWPLWEWAGPHNNPGYTNPTIALDSAGTIHVVWAGRGSPPYDIFYAYKPVGGTWSTYENLSNEGYNSVYPSIAIDSQDRIWVAWQASITDNNGEIYVRSKPAGGAWEPVMRITANGYQDLNVSITVDPSNVPHVVWRHNALGGNWEIAYTKYVGGAWTAQQNISANSSPSHFPDIESDSSGNLYVVWEDEIDGTDRFQILFRRWNGSVWETYKRVSSTPTKALYPLLGLEGSNVYVVWTDYRSNTDTYFNYSTDAGNTWHGDENVSSNGTSSFFPDVAGQPGGFAHIVWQDLAPGQWDIYYSKGTIPTPPPTATPTATPTNTPTPSPSPTPDPRPHGYVDLTAHDPPYDPDYTRLLTATVELSATSDVGASVTSMRVCNLGDPDPALNCPWIAFAQAIPNWPLLDNDYDCGYKWVNAWFRDNQGRESTTYSDYIVYDNYLTASMTLNGGNPYANHTMVFVHTEDIDGQTLDCSGLDAMSFSANGLTYTLPISYFPDIYFMLPPSGPITRTVYAQYWDRAGNTSVFSESLIIDTHAPTGTPPLLNNGVSSTTDLIIPITDLRGFDSQSGIANVWLANRADGPWMALPYCEIAPCSYTWSLGYGGPPILAPERHVVYLKYEDGSGYGPFPGNFSPIYTGTITVSGIYNVGLPVLPKLYHESTTVVPPVTTSEVGLILVSYPERAGPGQDVLVILGARRLQNSPLEGTMQLLLPDGLRVVRAWSAYGELLQVKDHLVVSRERAWSGQAPWILVQARVEAGGAAGLQVQGEMIWAQGIATAMPIEVKNR